MPTTPKYRDDIKGQVALHVADFELSIANELAYSDYFIGQLEETDSWAEHSDTLTPREMKAAYKRVCNQIRTGRAA